MKKKRLLILGGAGNTGRPLAKLLVDYSEAELVLAGRNLEKVQATTRKLNHGLKKDRVSALQLDASDRFALRQAFKSVDIVVVASSTARYTENVAGEALRVGIDYFDVVFSRSKLDRLKSLAPAIEKAGLCFISEGGFHPGLPALMVRQLSGEFDQLIRARVGSVIQEDWKSLEFSDATAVEMVEEFRTIEMKSFRNGRWVKPGLLGPETIHMNFGKPFGRRTAVTMYLEEMGALPGLLPGLMDAGFYVGGFNWFVDSVVLMLLYPSLWLFPQRGLKPMADFMLWGLKTFSRPPFGTLLRCECEGMKAGRSLKRALTISHPDGYFFTAAPAAACLLQVLDGSIRKPGLYLQALAVKPHRFMKDLKAMGIDIKLESLN